MGETAGPWYAIAAVVALAAIGYLELRSKAAKWIGLSTWLMGLAPFLALCFWLGSLPGFSVFARVIFVLANIVGMAWALSALYRSATSRAGHRKSGS